MTGYSPSLQSVNSNPEKQMAATPMKKANSTIMPRRAMTTMLLLIAKKASLRDSVKCRVSVSTKVSSGERKYVQHVGSPKINGKGEKRREAENMDKPRAYRGNSIQAPHDKMSKPSSEYQWSPE
jgi:hypothetical protein